MGAINIKHTESGSDITLSSDGTDLLLDGSAIGGAALELYAENPSSPTTPLVSGPNSVAVGSGSRAQSTNGSTAFGISAVATANASFAAGFQPQATGIGSLALGYTAVSGSTFSTAVGYNATTSTNSRATALTNSYATGADSFAAAIATNSSSYGATGDNSVAIGRNAKATSQDAIAIGDTTTASAINSYALGNMAVASAVKSAVFGGDGNVASGGKSVAIGGYYAEAREDSKIAFGGGYIGVNPGTHAYQAGLLCMAAATTDATATTLRSNHSTAGTNNQIILPNNSAYSFSGTIIARQDAASGSNYASWEIKGALLRDANAASTVLGNGIKNKLYASAGASAWDVSLTADTTNGGLKIEVTGAAATNIRWVATVNTSEVTY